MTLSRYQLSKLALRLDRRYAELLEEVRGELERSENTQYIELIDRSPADIGDQALGDALADLNLAMIDRHIRELRDIEATRARMHDRSFGTCIACGAAMAYERLLAYPTAKRCFACQRQRERTYADYKMPTL